MKKQLGVTILVGLTASLLGAGSSQAATVVGSPLDTKGTITFATDETESGNLLKPDENGVIEEIIKVDEGKSSSGPLRIQFVPDFKFGTNIGITANRQEKQALGLAYRNHAGDLTGKKVPSFVQVTNNTGDNTLVWDLTAKATEFQESNSSGGIVPSGHVLKDAYISLDGSTLTTTKGTSAEAATIARKQQAAAIPTTGANGIKVLSGIGDTNGRQISNVFQDDYKISDDYDGELAGVKFIKPAGVTPRKDITYKSTITWTLTQGL